MDHLSEQRFNLTEILGGAAMLLALFGSQHFVDSYYNGVVAKYHDAGQPLPAELQAWVDLQAQQAGARAKADETGLLRARSVNSILDAGQDIAFGVTHRGVDTGSK